MSNLETSRDIADRGKQQQAQYFPDKSLDRFMEHASSTTSRGPPGQASDRAQISQCKDGNNL